MMIYVAETIYSITRVKWVILLCFEFSIDGNTRIFFKSIWPICTMVIWITMMHLELCLIWGRKNLKKSDIHNDVRTTIKLPKTVLFSSLTPPQKWEAQEQWQMYMLPNVSYVPSWHEYVNYLCCTDNKTNKKNIQKPPGGSGQTSNQDKIVWNAQFCWTQ